MAKVRIGDRLISAGLITNAQLEKALEEQRKQVRRKKIVRVLVDLGYLEESKLLGFFVELCKRGELNLLSILEDFPNSEEKYHLAAIASLLSVSPELTLSINFSRYSLIYDSLQILKTLD